MIRKAKLMEIYHDVCMINLTQYVECTLIGVRCCALVQDGLDNILQRSCTGTREIMRLSRLRQTIQIDMGKRLKWIYLGGNYNITLKQSKGKHCYV